MTSFSDNLSAYTLSCLLLSLFLGGLMGIEREIHHKFAGFRTHILVSVGATLYTLISLYGFDSPNTDPSRVAAQIVTGIGFLGAGAIIHRNASVQGLTTAATLWISASIGLAVGVGMWKEAAIATFLALIVLTIFEYISNRYLKVSTIDRPFFLKVVSTENPLEEIKTRLPQDVKIKEVSLQKVDRDNQYHLRLKLVFPSPVRIEKLATSISAIPNVLSCHLEKGAETYSEDVQKLS